MAEVKTSANYHPRLTAKRVGEIGRLYSTSSRGSGFCGADEFFSCQTFPQSFLKTLNDDRYPSFDEAPSELIAELFELFRKIPKSYTYTRGAELRGDIWWAPVLNNPHGETPDPILGEVKLDLFEFVDRGYKRSQGGKGMGWKYAARKRLPTMGWRVVTRDNGEKWAVLADSGFGGKYGGWPMAGAVRLHLTS
jgi:hypothetical protein